jgi:hypothetical protein
MIQKKKILLSVIILSALHTHTKGQTFGRYADCTTGRGICGIGIENTGNETTQVTSQKFIVEHKTDSTVQLRIVKANINAEDEYKIFGTSVNAIPKNAPLYIYIDRAVPISNELRNRLAIAAAYTSISAGIYTASKTDQFYITELKLQ